VNGAIGRIGQRQAVGAVVIAVLIGVCAVSAAYSQTLVIEGGTLIDGNGGEPIRNSLVIIEGDRFRTVTTRDRGDVPAGARTISAEGKYVLPGFIDSHFHLADWHLETALAHGETTIVDTGNVIEWTLAVRDGIQRGKIRGPRLFVSNTLPNDPDSRTLQGRWALWGTELGASRKAEENLEMVRGWIDQGIDVLKFHPVSLEVVRVMAGEARRRKIPTMCHCDLNVLDTIPLGIQKIAHGSGIVEAIVNNAAEFEQVREARLGGHELIWDWSFASPAKYGNRIDDVIRFLVSNNIFLEPTIQSEWIGVYPETPEFLSYDLQFLHNHPALLSYTPPAAVQSFGDYTNGGALPGNEERAKQAYRNFQYFIRRFVQLGGKLHVSSDQTSDSVAGVQLHNEMILTQAAGVTPMQIITATTKHPAEWLGKLKELGTVEPGKIADLVIVAKDPLADIRNIKGNVQTVVISGNVIDMGFHQDFHNPIPGVHNVLKYLNEAPELDPKIVPRIVIEGRDTVKVAVKGRYLSPRVQAYFKDVAVPTRLRSPDTMEITIPRELLTQVGAWPIRAVNPAPNVAFAKPNYLPPPLSGASNSVFLWVKFR
jgi:hypothetical protein